MLKLYHYPLSPNSRRVWVALLEKEIPFEEVSLNLDGDQFDSEFLTINPFHHVPVLVDDDFRIVESFAILDYLEAKYPRPVLIPDDAQAIATVRMVEMITVNELIPAVRSLLPKMLGIAELEAKMLDEAKQKIATTLTFFERLLGNNPYFGGKNFSRAEIVAGTVVPQLPLSIIGMSLNDYPKLNTWCLSLSKRSAWIITQPSPEAFAALKARKSFSS